MFNQELKEKYSFATKFFESALNAEKRKLAHAFMLSGSDVYGQYLIAMEVAKYLNCESENKPCNSCTSCRWINKNSHPAVKTISPVDYLEGNKDGKAKTVISIDQARHLKNELANTSQYHRVIIFTNAIEGDENYNTINQLIKDHSKIEILPPKVLNKNDEERLWAPKPLTKQIFQAEPANALLKTIEEPGSNITFFFLTKDKEDMIDTIVSRCQNVPVNKQISNYNNDPGIIKHFLDKLPPKSNLEAIKAVEHLIMVSKEENFSPEELLDKMQEYFKPSIASDYNKNIVSKLIKNINKIEETKLQLKSYVNVNSALESLFLYLAQAK